MVLAVLSSDSLFIVRLMNQLFCTYPSCTDVIMSIVRRHWYASCISGHRLIHVWSVMSLRSQFSRSCWYSPHWVMRMRALMRSCWVVYRFLVRVAISYTSVHLLNRNSGGSCGLYYVKKVMFFCCIASGVGLMYVVASRLKMSWMVIFEFQPVVGGVVGGGTLKASLTALPLWAQICAQLFNKPRASLITF